MWDDHAIEAGTEWQEKITEMVKESDSIAFLVSPDLLASDYVQDEMELALDLHERQMTRVIPVIVRPADWEESPLGRFHALPEHGRAVSEWPNKDAAWLNVTQGIRRIVA